MAGWTTAKLEQGREPGVAIRKLAVPDALDESRNRRSWLVRMGTRPLTLFPVLSLPAPRAELWDYTRFTAGVVVLAFVLLWADAILRRRARASRQRAASGLASGDVEPFEIQDRRFRAFTPACPESEGFFVEAFSLDGKARMRVFEPSDVTEVWLPNPYRPLYGFSIISFFRRYRLVDGSRLSLLLKGRGKRTVLVRSGHVVVKGEARDISGMIGTYRPGSRHVKVYRHYSGDVPLEELLARVERIEEGQQATRADLEQLIATGEPFDLDGANLFGVDLSGLDLRQVRSAQGADMRYADVKGARFSEATTGLRRKRVEGTRFKQGRVPSLTAVEG